MNVYFVKAAVCGAEPLLGLEFVSCFAANSDSNTTHSEWEPLTNDGL